MRPVFALFEAQKKSVVSLNEVMSDGTLSITPNFDFTESITSELYVSCITCAMRAISSRVK